MKFSVSMYSYMQKIRSGEATPFELIAKTKELGFDAIEFVDFTDFGTGTKEERLAHAEELRKECERVGLEISALVMSCDFITGSDGDLDKEIARVKDYVDIAHVLGVTRMRHDAAIGYARNSGDFCPFDTMLPRLTKACKEITEYAAQFGIRTMVENHGFYVQDSERVEKLYAAVDNKNFGLLTDMGNFFCADEDPASAFARVAPYAYYVHAKDFIVKPFTDADPGEGSFRSRGGKYLRGTIVGHGNVPIKQCMYQLKRAGYDDYISIEFEGMEPVFDALRIGLANLKKYWAEV